LEFLSLIISASFINQIPIFAPAGMLSILQNEHFILTRPTVLAIGTFDGLHVGHKKILSELNRIASEKKLSSCLLTFEPHPRMVLGKPVEILTTLREKEILLNPYAPDIFVAYPFSISLSQLSPENYLRELLLKKMNARHLIVGYDHRFGKERTGNTNFLSAMAEKLSFDLTVIQPVKEQEQAVSSTIIRDLLKQGDIPKANLLLGHRYLIYGQVIKGEQRGHSLGFPTANLSIPPYKMLPKTGVYAAFASIGKDKTLWPAMVNIGTNPTFESSGAIKTEAHILTSETLELYGKKLSLHLVERVRNEIRFPSREKLIEQLYADKQTCLKILL